MSRRLSDHDRRAWALVARTVRPAAGRALPEVEEPPATTGVRTLAADRHAVPPLHRATLRPGINPGPLADVSNHRPVRRGQLDVEARLDLHGHTQDTAFRELAGFLLTQRAIGARCVLVITGKGRLGSGVLRSRFFDWIGSAEIRPLLAGYSRAHVRHGGDGAFYLLLKAKR
ncbi:MAG: Smr/MutS family protein [Alphaproteobacteria bacterium]